MKEEHDGLDRRLADGELGGFQIDKTVEYLWKHKDRSPEQKIIICLHHHPFLFPDDSPLKRAGEAVGHWLKDGREFMKSIKDFKEKNGRGVDIMLFGHEHRHLDFTNTIICERRYDIPHIVSSGKSTEYSRAFPMLYDGSADIPVTKRN